MLASFKSFFSDVQGSIKGLINAEELYRSILTAFGSGTTIGLFIYLLQAVLAQAGTIFPDPTVATLATTLLTLVLDLLRRQNQGVTPTPAVSPASPVAPSPQVAQFNSIR